MMEATVFGILIEDIAFSLILISLFFANVITALFFTNSTKSKLVVVSMDIPFDALKRTTKAQLLNEKNAGM